MEMNQVYDAVNGMTKEILGESAVVAEDLSNIVDIGKAVFDNASNFKLENTMSLGGGGGIDGMGCTNLHYKSESGGNIYLSIDGGFPIPESACLDFDCDGYFHEFMKDICVAFGEYYKKDFGYYRLIVTSNCKGKGFVCIELYESEKQFNRIAKY